MKQVIDRATKDAEPSLPKLEPLDAIKALAHDLIDRPWNDADIKQLDRIIAVARGNTPEDKKNFVRLVNFVLDTTRHRISFSEQINQQAASRLARLCVNPGKGTDIIQFELGGGAGSRGGFSTDLSRSISIIPYKYGDANVNRA